MPEVMDAHMMAPVPSVWFSGGRCILQVWAFGERQPVVQAVIQGRDNSRGAGGTSVRSKAGPRLDPKSAPGHRSFQWLRTAQKLILFCS